MIPQTLDTEADKNNNSIWFEKLYVKIKNTKATSRKPTNIRLFLTSKSNELEMYLMSYKIFSTEVMV